MWNEYKDSNKVRNKRDNDCEAKRSIGKGETKQAARILDYINWSLKIYHLKISFNT